MKFHITDYIYISYPIWFIKLKQFFIRIGKAIWFTLIDIDGKYKRSHEGK